MNALRNAWKNQVERQQRDPSIADEIIRKQNDLQDALRTTLDEDEATLISLHRMGARFTLASIPLNRGIDRFFLVLCIIQLALSQIPTLLNFPFNNQTELFYVLNLPLVSVTFLSLYLIKSRKNLILYLAFLGILALVLNYQFSVQAAGQSQTKLLAIIHLPLLLILSLALPTQEGTLQERISRHIRLTGEVLLLMFLLGCALMALMLLSITLFESIGLRVEDALAPFMITGILPLLPLVARYLLGQREAQMESLTKLLAAIFLPVLTILMLSFLVTMMASKIPINEERNLLLLIDLLLALVLLMILYATDLLETGHTSAVYRFMLITAALVAIGVDLFALVAISQRFLAFGLSPNRLAVLAENLLLLCNLGFLAVTLLSRKSFIRMQSIFMVLYGGWFLVVVLFFGPLFGFS